MQLKLKTCSTKYSFFKKKYDICTNNYNDFVNGNTQYYFR